MTTEVWQKLALAGVLLASLVIRVWYGSYGLDYRYAFDERYVFENVEVFLEGDLEPASGWYPSLSYLPHVVLLGTADHLATLLDAEDWQLKRGNVFSSEAMLASRILQAVFGTVGIALVFFIGRTLFGARCGLLAAGFLGLVPGHIRLSGIVKPDVLMTTLLLAVVLVSLEYLGRPRTRTLVLGAVLVGLAAAAKQYGLVALVPLAVAVLLAEPSWKGRVKSLLFAAGTTLGVFVVLNPWLGLLVTYAARNHRIYAGFSQGRLHTLMEALRAPLSGTGHGLVPGVLALAGLVLLAVRMFGKPEPAQRKDGVKVLLATVAGYVIFCGIFLPWSKYNLWVPLFAFTSLALAVVFITVLDLLRQRIGSAPAAVAVTVIVGLAVWPGVAATYLDRVPPTHRVVRDLLREEWPDGGQRLVYQETGSPAVQARGRRGRDVVTIEIERLRDLPDELVDLADAEVFPASRLGQDEGGFYRRRVAAYRSGTLEVRPQWFRASGEALVLIRHGWTRRGRPMDVELARADADRELKGSVAMPGAREAVVSLELRLDRDATRPGTVRIGAVETGLVPTNRRGNVPHFVTSRVRVRISDDQRLTVAVPARQGEVGAGVRAHFWRLDP